MHKIPRLAFRTSIGCALATCATVLIVISVHAQNCPTNADPIVTDRPDVTNSALVVPTGTLQAENGIDLLRDYGSNALDLTNTRLRLGVARCTEFVLDVPSYREAFDGPARSGFSDTVLSFKRQLPVPFGFDLSATAGLGFPSGQPKIVGRGYQPYIQFPCSHRIVDDWELSGMFTVTWYPSDSPRNPTLEPTLSIERGIDIDGMLFAEYVGDYDRRNSWMAAAPGGSPGCSGSISTPASASIARPSIATSGSATYSASMISSVRPNTASWTGAGFSERLKNPLKRTAAFCASRCLDGYCPY